MAGFRKAQAQQAYMKIGMYGPPGSGKTFTALLIAEGLANHSGKRVAVVDTERGTDFYSQSVARPIHPEAFDFDALYTRSIVETLDALRGLDAKTHGVVVIDSISHIWDAAIAAYKGKTTSIGTIPMQAWGAIKKPYKDMMALLLSMPMHVIICGRQANEMGENADGEMAKVGVKMRAEGETQYEPHVTIRMEASKARKPGESGTVMAIIEKDRTGLLQGKVIPSPNFDTLIRPCLALLGSVQARVETDEEVGQRDAEAMSAADAKKAAESHRLFTVHKAAMEVAATKGKDELDAAAKALTPEVKKAMTSAHVAQLRDLFVALSANVRANSTASPVAEEVAS